MKWINVICFVGKESKVGGFWLHTDDESEVNRHIRAHWPNATDIVIVDVTQSEQVEIEYKNGDKTFVCAGSEDYVKGKAQVFADYDKQIDELNKPTFLKCGECEIVRLDGGLFVLYC